MKRIIMMIVACATMGVANAVIVQKIELKNGSVLEGYIQAQNGSGRMTVHTDKAMVIVQSPNVEVFDRQQKVGALSEVWKDWAEKHDAFIGVGDSRTLLLNDVSFKDNPLDSIASDSENMNFEEYLTDHLRTVSNVKVLERGVTVKYLELTPNSYIVSWKDIKAITADRRPKNALSGINRIYELRNGKTYEGQYAGEADNSLSLYMDNGMVHSFKVDDVVKYTFRPINPDQDVFEQSELLDVIRTNRGTVIKGIILEQNYSSKKDSENLFLIQTASGAIQTVKVSDIAELRKEENPKYAPKFDLMLKEGEVVVNRNPATFVKVVENDDLLVLDSIGKIVIMPDNGGKILVTIEYRISNSKGIEAFQLIKVTESKIKKQRIYCFSYKDLVNSVYHAKEIETSINKTTKAVYELNSTGVYALYDAKGKRAIPFTVKRK